MGRLRWRIAITTPEAVRPVQTKAIQLSADGPSYLLFDWLNELLFAFENEKLLLTEFAIELQRGEALNFTAICRGEFMDQSRHQMDHEVKAITYHGLRVEQKANGWEAELIVDI
jgi:SHS2 domain-containing protein